jgi:hypothetical protein
MYSAVGKKSFYDQFVHVNYKAISQHYYKRTSRSDYTRPGWFAGKDIFYICGQAVPGFVKNISLCFTNL